MRRSLLMVPMLIFAIAPADTPTCPPDYSYSGFMPPSQWQFVKEWKCGTEPLQSPIDISRPFAIERNKPITVHYESMPITVTNSGHDFRVTPTKASSISVGGITATLDQFHFHVPSEHTMDGKRYAGEIHFVHIDPATHKVYVIAVLLRSVPGINRALEPIIAQLPINLCASGKTSRNLAPLLPPTIGRYYRYVGSLTTPACDGDVTFFVLPAAMAIGEQQILSLHRFGDNARKPVQPRNARTIVQVVP